MSDFLYDHLEVIFPLSFSLDFAEDTEIRKRLIDRYFLEELIYPDDNDLMAYQLQAQADRLAFRYNELYKTTVLDYDPLDTDAFSASEDTKGKSSAGTRTGSGAKNFDYAQDTTPGTVRPTAGSVSNVNGSSKADTETHIIRKESGHRGRSAMSLIAEQRRLILDLVTRYVEEFTDFFIIRM